MKKMRAERPDTSFPWVVYVPHPSGNEAAFFGFEVGAGVMDFVAEREAWDFLADVGLDRTDLLKAVHAISEPLLLTNRKILRP